MKRGQFCIRVVVTDDPDGPARYLTRGGGAGRLRTTKTAPLFGRKGNESTEDQILFFYTAKDAAFFIRHLSIPPGLSLVVCGPDGPIEPGDHRR